MKRLKPKTTRRLLLLSIVFVMTVTAFVGLVFVRKWQDHRRADRLRAAGMECLQQGDYPQVLDNLGRYLRRRPQDREAWLAYAKSRELVEESNGSHLLLAMNAYQHALALDDADRPTALKLLTIYDEVGYYTEAKDLALKLRPDNPADATEADAPVLAAEAAALFGLKSFDEPLGGVTARLVALDPSGYRPAAMRINWLLETKHNDEATAFVSSLPADDVRFRVLREIVNQSTTGSKDTAPIVSVLCLAAALDQSSAKRLTPPAYTDMEFAEQLVTMFDGFRMFSHSMAVLRDAADRLGSTDFKRLYVRRLWQSGLMKDLCEYLANLDQGPRGAHSEVLAFRCLASRESGHPEDATSALAALRSRDRDFYAQAWASALSGMFEEQDPRAGLALVESAIKAHPREPVFAFMKGECLARLGRAEEARAAWIQASRLSTGWTLPLIRTSQTLLDEGRLDEAARAAAEAQANNPASIAAAVAVARAQVAILESGRLIPDPEKVLARFNEMKATFDKLEDPAASQILIDSLLPGEVALLTATGKPDQAKDLIRKALHARPAPSADMIRRLAAASARAKLGLEEECFAPNLDSPGAISPQLALTRALYLNGAGKRDEGLALIQKGLAAASPPDDVPWRLARAQFFDVTADPGALDVWRDLTETAQTSLPVQLAALRSSAAVGDLAYMEQLIKRVVALGGSDPDHPSIDVRLARARALLKAPLSTQTRDEAVSILRRLVIEAPAVTQVRDSLIAALLLEDPKKGIRADLPGAIEQLRAAAASPEGAPYTIRLAQLLIREGRPPEAASELSKLALNKLALPNQRLAAIDMLIAQRELEKARASLESMLSENNAERATDVLLRQANVLTLLRRDSEALGVLREIARRPIDDPDQAVSVAIALRSLGAQADATRLIALLSSQPGQSNKGALFALARYAETGGDAPEASRLYKLATDSFPSDPEVWTRLARFRLARSEFPAAANAAREGLTNAPNNPDLLIVLQQALLAQAGEAQADLTPLADALAKSPATARRAEAIRSVQQARSENKSDDPATLAAIADSFQDDPTTQAYVVTQLLSLRPPALTEAVRVSTRALARFPAHAEVASTSAITFASAGDWARSLEAAEAWRQLSRAPAADVAAAEANIQLNHPRQAADLVSVYSLPPSIEDKDLVSLGILNVQVRSAVMLEDTVKALATIEPYLDQSSVARTRIALPTAASLLKDPELVARWIDRTAAHMDPASIPDQLAIANTWGTAANRFAQSKRSMLESAIAVTDKLITKPEAATAKVFEIRAALFESLGSAPAAIAAWREAISREPDSAFASSNLARLLLATDPDPAQAIALARQAIGLNPADPAPWLVLVEAQLKQADLKAAAGDQTGHDAALEEARVSFKSLPARSLTEPESLLKAAGFAERLNDYPAAVSCYDKALTSQAISGRSLAITQNNLAYALYRTSDGNSSATPALRRAKGLVEEAIRFEQLAPFLDTLGCINSALEDRPGAIDAYRKAIDIDPHSTEACIGLADLLSAGTPQERAEASRVLAQVDAAIAAGETVSTPRKAQLQQLRQRLVPR